MLSRNTSVIFGNATYQNLLDGNRARSTRSLNATADKHECIINSLFTCDTTGKLESSEAYGKYVLACSVKGTRPHDVRNFGKLLFHVFPHIGRTRPRSGKARVQYYLGLALKSEAQS